MLADPVGECFPPRKPADLLAILFTEFRLPGRAVYPRLWTRPLKGLWPLLPSCTLLLPQRRYAHGSGAVSRLTGLRFLQFCPAPSPRPVVYPSLEGCQESFSLGPEPFRSFLPVHLPGNPCLLQHGICPPLHFFLIHKPAHSHVHNHAERQVGEQNR